MVQEGRDMAQGRLIEYSMMEIRVASLLMEKDNQILLTDSKLSGRRLDDATRSIVIFPKVIFSRTTLIAFKISSQSATRVCFSVPD